MEKDTYPHVTRGNYYRQVKNLVFTLILLYIVNVFHKCGEATYPHVEKRGECVERLPTHMLRREVNVWRGYLPTCREER